MKASSFVELIFNVSIQRNESHRGNIPGFSQSRWKVVARTGEMLQAVQRLLVDLSACLGSVPESSWGKPSTVGACNVNSWEVEVENLRDRKDPAESLTAYILKYHRVDSGSETSQYD